MAKEESEHAGDQQLGQHRRRHQPDEGVQLRLADRLVALVAWGSQRESLGDAGLALDPGGEARDLFWTCTSPELFELLVIKRGWTPERYGQWVGDTFIATLLEPLNSPS